MKISIKINKLCKELKTHLFKIIIRNLNYTFKKKDIIYISYIDLSKNLTHAKIYIDFINQKNKNIINNYIYTLQKHEKIIQKKLKQTTYIKYIPKITFLHEKFNKKKLFILNLIKKANKK